MGSFDCRPSAGAVSSFTFSEIGKVNARSTTVRCAIAPGWSRPTEEDPLPVV